MVFKSNLTEFWLKEIKNLHFGRSSPMHGFLVNFSLKMKLLTACEDFTDWTYYIRNY